MSDGIDETSFGESVARETVVKSWLFVSKEFVDRGVSAILSTNLNQVESIFESHVTFFSRVYSFTSEGVIVKIFADAFSRPHSFHLLGGTSRDSANLDVVSRERVRSNTNSMIRRIQERRIFEDIRHERGFELATIELNIAERSALLFVHQHIHRNNVSAGGQSVWRGNYNQRFVLAESNANSKSIARSHLLPV